MQYNIILVTLIEIQPKKIRFFVIILDSKVIIKYHIPLLLKKNKKLLSMARAACSELVSADDSYD